MIFKLVFEDKTEFAQAESLEHLEESYREELDGYDDVQKVTEISDEEAKKIMLKNTDYNETDPDDEEEISTLQSEVHKITGDGEVMQLFNKLLGVNAG